MDTLELWEEEINSNSQLIEEDSKPENVIPKKIANIYCHMVKYKYCREHQNGKWVETIMRDVHYISDNDDEITTNVRNNIDVDKAKRKGFEKAKSEVKDNDQSLTISKIENSDIPFNTLDDFKNPDKASQWLKDNFKEDIPNCYEHVKSKLDKL